VPWEELTEDDRKQDRRQVEICLDVVYDLHFAVAPA